MKRLIHHSPTLLRLVILLLMSNIILAVLFFVRGHRNEGRGYKSNEAIEAEVKKELGLSETQTGQFRIMLKKNRDSLQLLGKALRAAKNNYYALLQDPSVNDSIVRARNSDIAAHQAAMDQKMFSHFHEVRSMLNDRQRPLYDTMVMRIINRSAWTRKGSDR